MRTFGLHPRRSFLQRLLAWPALAAPKRAPLPKPRFYWGVGIENTWMAQTDPAKDGQRRLLDVYLQMQHYDHWKQDLDLLAATGVNAIRYSVPWYRAEPKPGVYDWSWIDKPVDYLVNKLKIIPIMDLMHYGTPTWMLNGVGDPRFAESIGRYAGAMATHFKGLVNHYSPQNEPGLTCILCGLTGRWPPYQKGVDSWARIGVQVAKAMVLETWAIRAAIPDSVIVSVDPWFWEEVDGFLPKPADPELRRAAAAFPASLAYGKVKSGHPLAAFLEQHGANAREIAWFVRNHATPDILGYNYYPDIHDYHQFGDFTRHGSLPLEQAAKEAATLVGKGIRDAHAYFNLPTYLTETSAGLADASKVAYINALCDLTQQLRQEGLPFAGINWWPLFDSIQWDYREKFDKPLKPFIYKGGWNNGLYVIGKAPGDELPRVKTPAVDAWRAGGIRFT
ncbi:MAG TPA: family 1 glycosylhydrolase [Bryobacteraceae bacterium]|jgi:beta-glucosidase/6-phospho-beta-glucosidase/beta-galactosidase